MRPIDSTIVGERFHAGVGLLHPIVIRPDGVLIGGERRLAACRSLRWREIRTREFDFALIASCELAESAIRKDLPPSEIDAIRRALEPAEKAAAKERMGDGGKGAEISPPSRVTDKIGAFAGVVGRSVEKIAAACAAADAEPGEIRQTPTRRHGSHRARKRSLSALAKHQGRRCNPRLAAVAETRAIRRRAHRYSLGI
jgi:ParB-like chromosome segregation protein Spo0J